MNRQDILALGLLIVILGLFFGLAAPKTYKIGKFDGTNINFMAGETFTLTIDRGATTDAEISKMNVESNNYPFSENWSDFGTDGIADRDEITPPEKFTDTKNTKNGKWDRGEKFVDKNSNGKWDRGEKFTDTKNTKNGKWDKGEKLDDKNGNGKWDGARAFDRNTNPDPHYDNYSANNPNGTEKNDQWDKGEKFVDVDGNSIWTAHLLEFRWEKIMPRGRGNFMSYTQTVPLNAVEGKPYILEYVGSDVGELKIKLTVIDKRSSFRNGYPVVVNESFKYTCNKIMEEAPVIKGQAAECCEKVL